MNSQINPFIDLYLAERIGEERFVKLFSPMFVQHALPLFQTGNVILKGLQGSGKTMLLHLLKPGVRIAYYRAQDDFPVPEGYNCFIGAGINLRKSGTINFSQLLQRESSPRFVLELVLYFADFVNCLIVDDLLQTVNVLQTCNEIGLCKKLGVTIGGQELEAFALALAKDDCWFGAFNQVSNFNEFKEKLRNRIRSYRSFINLNCDELPVGIKRTKTSIGEPVLKTAEYLHQYGILSSETKVFVRIDQYEQLATLNVYKHNFGEQCQQVIHKALAARDPRVSYRIGTRHYAWPDRPIIFGTNDVLEHRRDFSITDIDEKLRRQEIRRAWIFPKFAADIFERRLDLSKIKCKKEDDLLKCIFGTGLSASDKAKKYVKSKGSRRSIVRKDKEWPKEWGDFLSKLAEKDPLSAKLGEAWCRQVQGKGKKDVMYNIPAQPFPWVEKKYWKKERKEQALLQIASRNHQQLHWSGKDDIIGLSGGNILVFLFLCQHIWDVWLRDNALNGDKLTMLSYQITDDIQSMGIVRASEEWRRKQQEGADAKKRQDFVQYLGGYYYKILTEDKAMSNPGKNGFSIKLEDLKKDPEIDYYLKIAVGYGDLYDAAHTSKTKGEKRRKYYLAPILCPAFKIPFAHTKEPEYINGTKMVRKWLGLDPLPHNMGVDNYATFQKKSSSGVCQLSLFSDKIKK